MQSNTANGLTYQPVYAITVILRGKGGQRTFVPQLAMGAALDYAPFDLIIGRSILQHGWLNANNGTFFFDVEAG